MDFMSFFMENPDPGYQDIGKQIISCLDDSAICQSRRVCKAWHGILDQEWQKRKLVAMHEQIKPEIQKLKSRYYRYEFNEFLQELLIPDNKVDIAFASNHLIQLASETGNTNVLNFVLNHPNIKTVTIGHGCLNKDSWSTSTWYWDRDLDGSNFEKLLKHPKVQPYGFDPNVGKSSVPFNLGSVYRYLESKCVIIHLLKWSKIGTVDFMSGIPCYYGGETVLHTAIRYDDTEIAKFILDHKDCKRNVLVAGWYSESSCTPLHYAIRKNRKQIVKMILDHPEFESNFLKTLRAKHALTPLNYMMESGSLDVVKMILDHRKFEASFMLSLDSRFCQLRYHPSKEIQRFVLQHPKMKRITDFAAEIEFMKKNLK